MEMAAYFAGKAGSVSVVGRSATPYIATLGETIGKALQQVRGCTSRVNGPACPQSISCDPRPRKNKRDCSLVTNPAGCPLFNTLCLAQSRL